MVVVQLVPPAVCHLPGSCYAIHRQVNALLFGVGWELSKTEMAMTALLLDGTSPGGFHCPCIDIKLQAKLTQGPR